MAISQPDQFIALLGGGQLGKMLLAEARRMDLSVHSMDPDHMAPCRLGSHRFVQGDFTDYHQVMDFSQGATAVVIEIESVNVKALEDLEAQGIPTFPSAKALRLIQNKIKQKTFYRDQGIPTSDFQVHANHASLQSAIAEYQLTMPFVWKLAEGGYDGFGVAMINKASDMDDLPDLPCITEAAVEIDKEIAVVIVRDRHGNTEAFPPVEMAFHPTANQVEFVVCPTSLSDQANQQAVQLAKQCAEAFNSPGLLAVELFLTKSGDWLVNEVAPRPHNSGHLTIEACPSSQFEQLLRVAFDLPMGSCALQSAAAMANLVGAANHQGDVMYQGLDQALVVPGSSIHIYGKSQTRPFRKMGHVTATGKDPKQAMQRAAAVRDAISVEAKPSDLLT